MRFPIVFLLTLIPLYTFASFIETLIHGSVAPKQQQRINNFVYDECGMTKTCFGIPDNCITTQSCEAIATAVVVGNNYHFELQSYDENIAYVALGLSRDNRMAEDSVMECVNEEGTAKAYVSYNNRRDNTREGVPQNIISLLDASIVDGLIYCKIERQAVTTVLNIEFHLPNEDYHFLLATGSSLSNTLLVYHDLGRVASAEPMQIIERQAPSSIYEGCGTKKTCFGLPLNCVAQESCEAIVTATIFNNRHQFELESSAAGVTYIALGLSRDALMGNDSVTTCIRENSVVRLYSSFNERRANYRNGVPQNTTTLLNSSLIDGAIYCKFERVSVTTVEEHDFNLLTEDFHFLIAIGSTVTETDITRHDLGRLPSPEPLEIIRQDNPIYEGCGTKKTCFGLPLNCVAQKSCEAIVTATIFNNRHQFELESSAAGVTYIALGLSRDALMGNDSVTTCVRENSVVRLYSSFNERRANYRNGVPQNTTTLLNSSLIDGAIYCKFERESVTTVEEHDFNLLTEDFHFLIAIGSTVTETDITRHDLGRLPSPEPLEIIRQKNPIYDGCGSNKTCFGMPDGCIANETCQAIVTVLVEDEERYQFELQSGVAGVRYVSYALSRDNLMGDDSVIECLADGGNVTAFHSWNTAQPSYENTRVDVSQDVFTLLGSSYTDGIIYCKIERESSTIVRGNAFNLANEDFHFMLAIGTDFTENSILLHDLGQSVSDERFDLPGRGSTASHVLKISAMNIVVWLLATSCTHFLREL